MPWKDIFPGREEMRSNIIEVKPTTNSRKWFKASIIWLVISVVLSFAAIPVVMIEMVYFESCFTMLAVFIVSPLIPAVILWATWDQMKRIPARVELYADRIRFVHYKGFKSFPIDVPWGEITEIHPYDKLMTCRGQEVRLHYLEKEGMDRILGYIEHPEMLNVSDVVSLMNLDRASRRLNVEPTEKMSLEASRGSQIATLVMAGLLIVPISLVSVTALVISVFLGDIGLMVGGGLMSLLFVPLTILLFVGGINAFKERTFQIDRAGVRLILKKGPAWDHSWNDLVKVSNGRGKSTRWVTFHPKGGKAVSINSEEFKYDDLLKIFKMVQSYCAFYRIPVVNMLGW
ncbi:MAG: hypothetical protein ACMUHM_08960 [Thermoplasmatota archaeon]